MKQIVEKLPEWFIIMPLESFLSTKEISSLFNFSSSESVSSSYLRGHFPKPDSYTNRRISKGTIKAPLWSKRLILQEIQRRKQLHGK